MTNLVAIRKANKAERNLISLKANYAKEYQNTNKHLQGYLAHNKTPTPLGTP